VCVLVGGVGGAKLAHGLAALLPPENLAVVVNTGDDFTHYGLAISPDLDTVMYTLAGVVDTANGWGVGGDTAHMLDMLRAYGETPWFRLGDRDLATHLLRTQALAAGEPLSRVTARLARALGVGPALIPMTDDPVHTVVETREWGALAFQEYFVRHRWQPTVTAIHYEGIERARLSEPAAQAIAGADVLVIAPSNPWLSIGPIVALPGFRTVWAASSAPKIAVTPIVAGAAIKGPAAKLMGELGIEVSAPAVGAIYREWVTGFVYDEQDSAFTLDGVETRALSTVMKTDADRAALAGAVLGWAAERSAHPVG
jgi:LPPG:FO 2-phospho-L-lactate transferase